MYDSGTGERQQSQEMGPEKLASKKVERNLTRKKDNERLVLLSFPFNLGGPG
jgi:hypothetical protein